MSRRALRLRPRDAAALGILALAALLLAALLLHAGPGHEEARGWLRLGLTLLLLALLAKGFDMARGGAEERYRRLFEEVARHTGASLDPLPRYRALSRGALGEGVTTVLRLSWRQGGYPFEWSYERFHKGRTTAERFPVRVRCRNPRRWRWAIRQDVTRTPFPDPAAPPTGDRAFDERYRAEVPREAREALLTRRVRERLLMLHPLLHLDLEGGPEGVTATLYQPTTDPYPYPYLFELLGWLARAQEGG